MKRVLFLLVAMAAIISVASANSGWMTKDCDKWGNMPMMGAMGDHGEGQMDHCQHSMMADRDHDHKQMMGRDHETTIMCVCKFGKSMMKKDKDHDMHMNPCDNSRKGMMNYGDMDRKSMMGWHEMGQKDKKKMFVVKCACQKVSAKSHDPPADPPRGGGEGFRGGEMGEGRGFEGGEGFEDGEFGGEEEEGEFMPFFGDFDEFEPYEFGPVGFGEEGEGEFMPEEGVEVIR